MQQTDAPNGDIQEPKDSVSVVVSEDFSKLENEGRLSALEKFRDAYFNTLIWTVIFLCFISFVIAGLVINFKKTIPLLFIASCIILYVLYKLVWHYFGATVRNGTESLKQMCNVIAGNKFVRWCVYLAFFLGVVALLVKDNFAKPERLISVLGLLFFLAVSYIFSINRAQVNFRPVIWGITLQVIMALIVLRWDKGRDAFDWLSRVITAFLNFTTAGTSFVYGFLVTPPNVCNLKLIPIFAFSVLPTVIFFSSVINILYYFGIMQIVVLKMAGVMTVSLSNPLKYSSTDYDNFIFNFKNFKQFLMTMGTTGAESLSGASNIFIGQTEAPLLIKPYISKMTNSEIHAVMVCGFATIAGGLFNVYVSFGACANHILTASVMSAPASIAIAKLLYPETEVSVTKDLSRLRLATNDEKTAFEAAANGAVTGIILVTNIIANLVAFMALLAFFDWLVTWLATMVNHPEIDFKTLLSWMFYPVAVLMRAGENHEEFMIVSELLGIKTFINEFVAYERMKHYIQKGKLSPRAQLVATYSLCGFSNFTSIGIQIGGIGAMCPEKKSDIAGLALRAMVAGSIACFMTACIAGLLTNDLTECVNAKPFNTTNCTNL